MAKGFFCSFLFVMFICSFSFLDFAMSDQDCQDPGKPFFKHPKGKSDKLTSIANTLLAQKKSTKRDAYYGHLFLEGESSQKETITVLNSKYRELLKKVQDELSKNPKYSGFPGVTLPRLLHDLGYTSTYCKNDGENKADQLSTLLLGGCGNNVAHTKLFSSLVYDLPKKNSIPKYGVMVCSDAIRPVSFSSKGMFDLLSGLIQSKPDCNVYDNTIFPMTELGLCLDSSLLVKVDSKSQIKDNKSKPSTSLKVK